MRQIFTRQRRRNTLGVECFCDCFIQLTSEEVIQLRLGTVEEILTNEKSQHLLDKFIERRCGGDESSVYIYWRHYKLCAEILSNWESESIRQIKLNELLNRSSLHFSIKNEINASETDDALRAQIEALKHERCCKIEEEIDYKRFKDELRQKLENINA